jgi:hypothetical protein
MPGGNMHGHAAHIVQYLDDLYLTDFTKFTSNFANGRPGYVSAANVR